MKRADTRRSARLGDQIRQELSLMLLEEIQDPRLAHVTITGVRMNTDLRIAEVLFTAGAPEHLEAAGQALAKAAGYLRTHLGKRLTLRYLPELRFKPDDFLEDMIYARPASDTERDS